MHRLAWAAATLILMALSFAAGKKTLGERMMPEIVATLPNDKSQFSRELDARLHERFPRNQPGQAHRLLGRGKLCSGLASRRRQCERVHFQRFDMRQGARVCFGEPTPQGRSPTSAAPMKAIVCDRNVRIGRDRQPS